MATLIEAARLRVGANFRFGYRWSAGALLFDVSSGSRSFSGVKGTMAETLVPLPGFDSTEKVPWTRFDAFLHADQA